MAQAQPTRHHWYMSHVRADCSESPVVPTDLPRRDHELLFFMQPGSPTAFSSVKSLDILLINVLFGLMPPIPTDRTFKFSSQRDSLL